MSNGTNGEVSTFWIYSNSGSPLKALDGARVGFCSYGDLLTDEGLAEVADHFTQILTERGLDATQYNYAVAAA